MIQAIKQKLISLHLFDPEFPVHIIKTSYYNQVYCHKDLIIKLTHRHQKLQTEFYILRQIDKKIRTPKPIHFSKLHSYSCLISEKITGETAEKIWDNLNKTDQSNILTDLVKTVKQLHEFKIKLPTYYEFIEEETTHFSPLALQNPHHKQGTIQGIINLYHQHKSEVQTSDPRLIHHDLWYSNLIIWENEFKGLIDFEISLNGGIYLELYKILQHLFTAQVYFDQGQIPYTRIDFIKKLISTLKTHYPQLFKSIKPETFLVYNIHFAIRLLGRHTESWYKPEFTEKYLKELCNLENCKNLLEKI